jgi:transcriptional regulator with GAF, ATPase, and Fis domain
VTDLGKLTGAFVELADTMVDEFDMVDFLDTLAHRSMSLLGGTSAGVMLTDHDEQLKIVASSDQRMHAVELMQLQSTEGPCLDAFRSRAPVLARLEESRERWPLFTPSARDNGYEVVCAFPLRLRQQTLGALNLFRAEDRLPEPGEAMLGQALADVATIGLLQERAVRESTVLAEQLQRALRSRVAIEQAKGMLAERYGIDLQLAFDTLRRRARDTNRTLADVAREVVGNRGR